MTKFEEGVSYPSAVKGVRFGIKSVHQVKDSICMVVYYISPSVMFGMTSHYYLAIVDEDDDSRATVLMDDGFTTIYAEEEE